MNTPVGELSLSKGHRADRMNQMSLAQMFSNMPVEIPAGAVGTHRHLVIAEHLSGFMDPNSVVIQLISTV